MGTSLGSVETRHRLSASIEDIYRRKVRRSKAKSPDKAFYLSPNSCNFLSLKLVLLLILCGTFLTLLCSPDVYNNHPISRSGVRWIWGGSDPRYTSNLDINWNDITKLTNKIKNGYQSIGLLNFNKTEITHWNHLGHDNITRIVLNLDPVGKNVTWEILYPEWIDEEEDEEVPACAPLPRARARGKRLDVVAVKLPCKRSDGNWSRDVARLHLQVAAAGVAAAAKGEYEVHVLLVTDCFPIPNLFGCKELVGREGNGWLYRPNLNVLRDKVLLPTGSCELALPLRAKDTTYSDNTKRQAYATILHSAHVYVCGAIAAARSIRLTGSTRDLLILVDNSISAYHRSGLEAAGWQVRIIQRIRNPKAEKDAYNEWNYSKFRLWQLTDYDKIIFIDADLLILRNIDFLFAMPEISATGNNGTLFNSGVMVIEPSNCTFELLMNHIDEIESYNGGDQGYLNEIFTWWHRIPKQMNFLKHFWVGDDDDIKFKKTRLFGADPPILYVIHYLGLKPWLCFRDYDCNWNVDIMREFASDVAHARWWLVHDSMPEVLQQFCALRTKQKAQLEWDRREAERGNYSDMHWRIRVSDSRLRKCVDNVCSWKGMLRHWGETNWTDDDFLAPSPPAISIQSVLSL